jgi:hypothetical protein
MLTRAAALDGRPLYSFDDALSAATRSEGCTVGDLAGAASACESWRTYGRTCVCAMRLTARHAIAVDANVLSAATQWRCMGGRHGGCSFTTCHGERMDACMCVCVRPAARPVMLRRRGISIVLRDRYKSSGELRK